jgi:radical SAM superfamily enzyme YgiQ (UPF0313 family)
MQAILQRVIRPEEVSRKRLRDEQHLGPRPAARGEFSFCLTYPNTYPVGMANLGFQAVYGLLGKQGMGVERAFLPDHRPYGKVRTLESDRALSEFDILAFSISFETDYVHVLDILAGAGLPLRREDRTRHDPLVVAGGPATFLNPEPLADFVDVFLIGEAEEMLPEWIEALRSTRHRGRDAWAQASETVAGAYLPANWVGFPHGSKEDAPRVERRYLANLDDFPTATRVVAPDAVFGDMFLVEASRGCEWGCRFCAAGYMYRPVRHRSEASLREQVINEALPRSSSVGLVGAEMASQPGIAALCHEVAERGARASPSSLKADMISPELASALGRGATRSVTVAPEAGSERLRRLINKNLTEEEILRAAGLLAEGGVPAMKLYSMIGLPTETDDDVLALIELARKIRGRLPGVGRITLSINPFVPKPWTPLQWEPMAPLKEVRHRAKLLQRHASTIPGATVDVESPREAYWQALLSRGDRRVGVILEAVHARGGKFWPVIREANLSGGLGDCPPPSEFVERRFSAEEDLPWDFIDHNVSKKYLLTEWRKALLERETAPCDVASCVSCGAC